VLKGKSRGLTGFGQYHIATPDSTCTTVSSVAANTTKSIGTVATTETGGAAIPYAVAQGPIRIAGAPYLTGDLTALGVNNRAFYGLAVGTSPADAHLVQDNMLPINETAPVLGEPRTIDLPAVAIDVPAGQTLYVMASPIDDIFVGMGSRSPGAVVLDNTVVHLPVVR
jgi:ABC-2 type transport system ATP-binding protein